MTMTKLIRLITISIYVLGFAFAQDKQSYEICPLIANQERPYIIQGTDNWLYGRSELVADIRVNDDAFKRIAELKKALDYVGMNVIFVNLPHRPMVHYNHFDLREDLLSTYDINLAIESYNNSIKTLENIGFKTPNILYYLNQQEVTDYGFKRDSHWTPNAAFHTAQAVREVVNTLPIYKELNYEDFGVVLKETKQRDSDLARYVMNACGGSYPPEPQKVYEITQTSDNSSLFADSTISKTVLWGTSYSRSSNFAEFLQAELNVEVVNYGFNVAGLWRSLRHYFLQNSELKDHPEVAIWEIPYGYYQEFNHLDIYEEIIPTVYGVCDEHLMVTPQTITAIPQTNILNKSERTFVSPHWYSARASIENFETDLAKNATNQKVRRYICIVLVTYLLMDFLLTIHRNFILLSIVSQILKTPLFRLGLMAFKIKMKIL